MAAKQRSSCFPILVAIASLVYNILVAALAQYLPDDPLYIGTSIAAYAWSGGMLSLAGLCGIIWNKPAFVMSLAHFLLLDTFMSALMRMLVLELFMDSMSADDLCTDNTTERPHATSALQHPAWDGSPHSVVMSTKHWQRQMARRSARSQRCRFALNAMQTVLIGILLCVTVAQGVTAMAMRRHSRDMEEEGGGSIRLTGNDAMKEVEKT